MARSSSAIIPSLIQLALARTKCLSAVISLRQFTMTSYFLKLEHKDAQV
jgi:hypothetical protein